MEKQLIRNFVEWLDDNGYRIKESSKPFELHTGIHDKTDIEAIIDRYVTMELPYEPKIN